MKSEHGIPSRLRPLPILLSWEGEVGRARVMELFDLSPVRASEWIRELRDLRPDWMVWDSVGRRYLATPTFLRTLSRQGEARAEETFALR